MTQQVIIDKYTFDASAKTITLPDLLDVRLEGIQLVTNVTAGVIIYQFNQSGKGGTLTGNILTLAFDTTSMASSDKLQIIYHPPSGGFFNRIIALLDQIWRATVRPEWLVALSTGKALRTLLDTNSNLNSVTTVTTVSSVTSCSAVTNLTNFNTIDSRELVWAQMRQAYTHGIRNRIN